MLAFAKTVYGKRNEFIKDKHGHQKEFKLPLERARVDCNDEYYPPTLHIDQDPSDGEECEADDYFEKYFLDPRGELREYETSLPDAAVVFGDEATVGTYAAIETAVHLARQQQRGNKRELSNAEWPTLC